MIAKSIIGIIIISLNLAGICFMILMLILALKNGFKKKDGPPKGKTPPPRKTGNTATASLTKADYLLDDIDLSEFDDLDLDEME
ncbi:MAG: hypothetical protein JEZ12_18485 [Desulfobacterium sp.]|nr:hypothetical protein [Desulfobacterium sp.]